LNTGQPFGVPIGWHALGQGRQQRWQEISACFAPLRSTVVSGGGYGEPE